MHEWGSSWTQVQGDVRFGSKADIEGLSPLDLIEFAGVGHAGVVDRILWNPNVPRIIVAPKLLIDEARLRFGGANSGAAARCSTV